MMSIGIVMVTFNSASVLGSCLESIPSGCHVVVVDNASRDDSAAIAEAAGVTVVRNRENRGFGAACNQGAKLLQTSHVLFLNPDAVLASGALEELALAIAKFPDAGGFGPAIEVPGESASFRATSYIQDQGRRYLSADQVPSACCEVDFVDGAAFVCNRQLFVDLGGFDEHLFLYFEDDDLSFRIRAADRRLIYVPDALVVHAKRASCGRGLRLHYLRAFHETRSRMVLSHKYGLPFYSFNEKKRAIIRTARALLTLNFVKAARYVGVFTALRRVAVE